MLAKQPSTPGDVAGDPSADPVEQHVVVLSGLSGAGKTAATKLFEDLGYTCVDNLPGELLAQFAELVSGDPERFAKVAVVLDVRSGDVPVAFGAMRGALEGRGIRPQSSSSRRATRSSSAGTRRHATATRSMISGGLPARSRRSGVSWSRFATRRTSSWTHRPCRCASCASGSSPT
jgi:hypothetical protein